MINKRIEELKKRINDYITSGGDIYSPKRELPYYNYLADTAKYIRKKTGQDVSIDEVYEQCGIKFNREYNHFRKFLTKLTPFVKNGYADEIRTKQGRTSSNVYEVLKAYSDKYDTTPFDFLVLMTGFKFENCYIKTNYIDNIKQELMAAYPSGVITGIRWEHPKLYEKLRQLQKYIPLKTVKETAEFLGFSDANMLDKPTKKVSETEVVSELKKLYPDNNIKDLSSQHQTLYFKVISCCRQNNKTTIEWMAEHGFVYSSGQVQPRLSQTKVDGEKRAQMLLNLKKQALESLEFNKSDPISLFEASLKSSQMVIDKLNKEQIKADLNEQQNI